MTIGSTNSYMTILDLPAATDVSGSESIWMVQGGVDKRATVDQCIASFTGVPIVTPGLNVAKGAFLPLPASLTATEVYRIDDTCGNQPRSATILSVIADIITLTTADAGQFFNAGMHGVTYARIWNMSKAPNQPAWVTQIPAANQLQVINATSIAGWVNGETIQIGDAGTPAATTLSCITLDISPAMQRVFGIVWPQSGVALAAQIVAPSTAGDQILYTDSGAGGSATAMVAAQVIGVQAVGNASVRCTELSPVSNSNLLRIREIFAGTETIRFVRASGIFA